MKQNIGGNDMSAKTLGSLGYEQKPARNRVTVCRLVGSSNKQKSTFIKTQKGLPKRVS